MINNNSNNDINNNNNYINNNNINNTTTTATHYHEQHSLPQLCPCCVDAGGLERNLLSETKCCPDSTSGSGSDAGPIRKHSSPDFQWTTSASEIDGKEKNRMTTETTLFNFSLQLFLSTVV